VRCLAAERTARISDIWTSGTRVVARAVVWNNLHNYFLFWRCVTRLP
jgi:hypothetical protein